MTPKGVYLRADRSRDRRGLPRVRGVAMVIS